MTFDQERWLYLKAAACAAISIWLLIAGLALEVFIRIIF